MTTKEYIPKNPVVSKARKKKEKKSILRKIIEFIVEFILTYIIGAMIPLSGLPLIITCFFVAIGITYLTGRSLA